MNDHLPGEFANFHLRLEEKIRQSCPSLKEWPLKDWLSVVASPYQIVLPVSIQKRVQEAVSSLYSLSRQPSYIQSVAQKHGEWIGTKILKQASVLMAYDFHYDEKTDRLGLIEVNTNASGFLLSSFLCLHSEDTKRAQELLWSSFCDEMGWGLTAGSAKLAIVDERPKEQKMYPEFLMYRDFFQLKNVATEIWDVADLRSMASDGPIINPRGEEVSFVYNRWNDFTFTTPHGQSFARAYLSEATRFSPHPREYLLLADKHRLVEWAQSENLAKWGLNEFERKAIESVLLKTTAIQNFPDPDALWKRRKTLFFKPAQSYGSKSAYRGMSITRKVFDRLLGEKTLVQDYLPAAEIRFGSEQDPWKYDLRFFVYRDQIHLASARLYRGQVTNFGPVGGGFAPVRFV